MTKNLTDVLGTEAKIGDAVVLTERKDNISAFVFGTISELDSNNIRFKILDLSGRVSTWRRWYYHNIESADYCKVLILNKEYLNGKSRRNSQMDQRSSE